MASDTLEEFNIDVECFKVICFIQRAGENWYGELLEDLKKGYIQG